MADDIEQLSTREIYRNPWMSVREDAVRFANGHEGIYSVVEKTDFVIVLPFENDGFWLVEQYRYPVRARLWEFPMGMWPAGRTGTAAELAAHELAEETGLRAASLVPIGRLYSMPGTVSQSFHVYLATDLSPGDTQREITEADMRHEWRSREQIEATIDGGEFNDASCVAALALFDRFMANAEKAGVVSERPAGDT